MKWTSLNDLREKYLSFFESKGHLRLPSYPLVPINDKSLLLINSGMAPMKKFFTGEEKPPRNRVTTCQKCIRTPDLECVGKTARHGTYFEMLGNFSFGDYFKEEAISWAWEFLTDCLEIPAEKLWPSVYEEDDEAYNIWLNKIGVPAKRIVKLGKEDNFWEHGTGPCGPCSEIYFDRGEKYGCGSPDCKPGCECDRYMEIWNNVFSQFDNRGDGTYAELKQKNIDTGMGLERLACIFQGVDNLFEVDTIKNILNHLAKIAGVNYKEDPKKDVSMRVITDHIRSTTFMISDGVMPSNEGRGYVLRRLLRRASRHGKLLNINRLFLSELCDTVINENKNAYPELVEKQDFIKKVITVEEENFSKTIDQGIKMLNDLTDNADNKVISGEAAFKLYDTYGFPLDITCDIAEEKGFTVDEECFNRLMTEQRERARSGRKASDTNAWKGENDPLKDVSATEFVGYTENTAEDKVLAIVKDGTLVDNATVGDEIVIVFSTTPFYAQSGGQVGDRGVIFAKDFKIEVTDTTKNSRGVFMHSAKVTEGMVSVGDNATLSIDTARRMAIRRNHTAAHLLQAALRKTLGTHVEQAGQLVNESTVRFDFTHFSALTAKELKTIEDCVNAVIFEALCVENPEMEIAKAKELGAMALFGEKYGDVVRVVKAGDFSVELCGGTHVDNTAKIGLFKIVSESSVAAGVRRIEALTGANVLSLADSYKEIIDASCASLKVGNYHDLPEKIKSTVAEVKTLEKNIESLEAKSANDKLAKYLDSAKDVNGIKVIATLTQGLNADGIKTMCDGLREQHPEYIAVFAANENGKIIFAVSCGKDATARGANAGKIVKSVAMLADGNGGGKPDYAMAGAKNAEKIDFALNESYNIIAEILK